MTAQTNVPSNAKQLWGKVLTRLRENGDVALFVSCGDISTVEIDGDVLVIKTDKEYLSNLIDTPENISLIKRALQFLGYGLKVEVKLVESENEKAEADIDFLKQNFGNFLKIE